GTGAMSPGRPSGRAPGRSTGESAGQSAGRSAGGTGAGPSSVAGLGGATVAAANILQCLRGRHRRCSSHTMSPIVADTMDTADTADTAHTAETPRAEPVVGVLGTVAVRRGGPGAPFEPVPGRRLRTVLAALALVPARFRSAAGLIEDVWGAQPPR